MTLKTFLTAAEIARRLGVSERRVQRLCKEDWERGQELGWGEMLMPNLIRWPKPRGKGTVAWWVPLEEAKRVLGFAVAAAGCGNNDGMDASGSRGMDAGSAGG